MAKKRTHVGDSRRLIEALRGAGFIQRQGKLRCWKQYEGPAEEAALAAVRNVALTSKLDCMRDYVIRKGYGPATREMVACDIEDAVNHLREIQGMLRA